jgi:ATP-binding protein involved in chromosome partitioning
VWQQSPPDVLPQVASLDLMPATREEILGALEHVIDPELGRSVVELDMVRDIAIEGGRVGLTISLTVAGCPLRASFQEQVDRALLPLDGIDEVALTFDVMSAEEKAALTTRLRGGVSERTPGISVDARTRVLAVASGKGGVGKSSLAANLAAAFSRVGHKTGVLDADVYGYSIPHMLGVHQRPVAVDDGERAMIVPPVRGDLKVMSIGFFLDENTPVMWRGPMLHRALEQFLSDVHWGELDTLVVDMPPGTGDVAISLGQLLPRAEAIVVTTPHRASQQVAVRAAQMARKTNMRLLGVVENMAYLTREDGSREELFGSGGGEALAAEVEAPLLGRIPFDPRLGALADEGEPIVLADPEAEVSRAIIALAEAVADTRREEGVGIVKPLPLVRS